MGSDGVEQFLREQRAAPAADYREFAPAPDLRELVACSWFSVVRRGGVGAGLPVVPDGCSDILLLDADAPVLVGPDSIARPLELPEGLVITGLRLRPGALRAVFGCSARLLLDQQVLLGDVAQVAAPWLAKLQRAARLEQRIHLLEAWLRARLTRIAPRDRALLEACRALSHEPRLDIARLTERLDLHPRTLHRQFIEVCGYGPKHLQRVMRVQFALRAAPHARSLAQLSSRAGFADQAHMTREFKALTGATPRDYLARHTPEVGAWLAHDVAPGAVRNIQDALVVRG